MKFCSQCGHEVRQEIPEGDHRVRAVCPACHTIHYENPKIIAGTLPVYQGKILICKRGIEPKLGFWTLPGGFMENGESLSEGALRETEEEACCYPEIKQLLSVVSIPVINQVHCFFLAEMNEPRYETTAESTEIQLIDPEELIWDDIAFKTVKATLKHYLQYRHLDMGSLPLLETSISPSVMPY